MRHSYAIALVFLALLVPLTALGQDQETLEFQGEDNNMRYVAFRMQGSDTLAGTVINSSGEVQKDVLAEVTALSGGNAIWKKFVFLGDMAPDRQAVVSEPYEGSELPEVINVRLYTNTQPLDSKNQGFVLSGDGWATSDLFNLEAGPALFLLQYQGQGDFSVTLLSSDNAFLGTLIEAEGSGTAEKAWDIDVTYPCKLEVNAEGPWTIAVMHPDNPISLSGSSQGGTRIDVQEDEDGVLLFSNY